LAVHEAAPSHENWTGACRASLLFPGPGARSRDRSLTMSPTARSLQHLRALGYQAEVVEKTIAILAIQCTSGSNVAARIQKLNENGFTQLWKSVGASLEVWGWAKQGPRGKRKIWTLRRETL
jgi:hypothetical protein